MLRALGRRIAQARLNHGWTQAMLANRIGLSLRSIRRMEAGAPGTAIGHIAQALDAFGVQEDLNAILRSQEAPTGEFVATTSVRQGRSERQTVGKQLNSDAERPAKAEPTTLMIGIGTKNLPVGRLDIYRDSQQTRSEFQYETGWLERPRAVMVSPELPLHAGVQVLNPESSSSAGLFSSLSDTAPGPWARRVIDQAYHLAKQSAPSLGPLDEIQYLFACDDAHRLGALRLPGATLSWWKHDRQPSNAIVKLVDATKAAWALETDTISPSQLTTLMNQGCFMGGSRPKLSYVMDDGRIALVKLAHPKDTYSVPTAEVLALKLARRAGINAAQAALWKIDGIPVAVITRFDRTPTGGRLHYVSAASLLNARGRDRCGYLELLSVMAQVCSSYEANAHELWRRLVFNALITRVDDNLRSIGFLYSSNSRSWELAPAVGLNPTPQQSYRSQTSLSAELGPITSLMTLVEHAGCFGLDRGQARASLRQIVKAIKNWRQLNDVHLTITEERVLQSAFAHERLREAEVLTA